MTKVLITGVSSGIGLAQARLFLKHGCAVYGVDKSQAPQIQDDNFHFLQLDLTTDLAALYDSVQDVDILCNTAGILDAYKPLLEVSDDELERVFQTNFFATVNYTPLLSQMVERQSGIIINMCSIASFIAGGGGAAYTASKHALAGFTRQLALDYAKDKIQIFGIAPGAVKTAMTASDFEPGGLADWVAQETPIGRWSNPEEIADLTEFLASGKASSMQGEIIKIDGGWSLK